MRKIIFFLCVIPWLALDAAEPKNALIVVLRGGDPALEAENSRYAAELERIFRQANRQTAVAVTRPTVLQALDQAAKSGTSEFTLVVLGHVSTSTSGRVSLAARGGRIQAGELAGKLDAVAAPQQLLLLCSRAGALAGKLANGKRTILIATGENDAGEAPRFPGFFVRALKELGAETPLPELSRRAGKLTEEFYAANHLARAEEYRLLTVSPPQPIPEKEPETSPSPELRSFSGSADVSVREALLPGDAATRRRLDEAKENAKKYSDFPAVCVSRHIAVKVNPDQSAKLEYEAEFYFHSKPSFAAFDAAASVQAEEITADNRVRSFSRPGIDLPQQPGSLLRCRYQKNLPASTQLPFFHLELPLESRIPFLTTVISVSGARYKVTRGDGAAPLPLSGNRLGEIPPRPPLRFEAFPLERTRLTVTTLLDWQTLETWFRRMADRALHTGGGFPAEKLKVASSVREKVRILYDHLNDMRYVTTPLGAAAFRPQTPRELAVSGAGDCKDKATALVAWCSRLDIRAHRMLIRRGGYMDSTFPSWQFNHMIVWLPPSADFPDGLFLDPTDGGTPFGDLPPGDDGSSGMVLTETGHAFRQVERIGKEVSRYREEWRLSRSGAPADRKVERSGFFAGQEERISRRTPLERRDAVESALAVQIPGATLRQDGGVEIPPGTAIGIPEHPERFFAASAIARPIRLFDGNATEIRSRITVDGGIFPRFHWNRSAAGAEAFIQADGDSRSLTLRFRRGTISPEEYPQLRKLVFETAQIWKGMRHE